MSLIKDIYRLLSNKVKISADRSSIESIGLKTKLSRFQQQPDLTNKYFNGSSTNQSISGFSVAKEGNIFVDSESHNDRIDAKDRGITKNNPALKAGIERLSTLVVEEGIKAKIISKSEKKNAIISKQIELLNKLWIDFTEECDFVDDSSFEHLQFLSFREVPMHGECFIVRKLKAYKRKEDASEKFKLKIQVFSKYSLWNELTFINTSHPDNTFPKDVKDFNFDVDFEKTKTMNKEGRLTAGNFTRNGIVYSPDYQPIAYLFKNTTNGFNTDGRFLEIPATDVAHVYFYKEANKRRGVPFIDGGEYVLKYTDDFLKSTLEKNNLASKFTFAIEKDLTDQESIDRYGSMAGNQSSGQFSARESFAQSAGGILQNYSASEIIDQSNDFSKQIALDMRPGQRFVPLNPPDNKDFQDFIKVMNQYVSNAIAVPYELVSGDWSQLNYSGGKAVFEVFKKQIYVYQKHIIISKICKPISKWFLDWAEDVLTQKEFDRSLSMPEFRWTAPVLGSLDPTKDTEATIEKIKHGILSPSAAVTEEGRDWNDTLREIAKDKKSLDALNINIYESRHGDVLKGKLGRPEGT